MVVKSLAGQMADLEKQLDKIDELHGKKRAVVEQRIEVLRDKCPHENVDRGVCRVCGRTRGH